MEKEERVRIMRTVTAAHEASIVAEEAARKANLPENEVQAAKAMAIGVVSAGVAQPKR